MIDKYSSKASITGARIIIASAYDSIPSKRGVYFLQQTAQLKFSKPVSMIKNRVRGIWVGFPVAQWLLQKIIAL